jgi:hypothetical protein
MAMSLGTQFVTLAGIVVLALAVACSDDDGSPGGFATPVAPSSTRVPTSPTMVLHDTLNPSGGTSNTEFFATQRGGRLDRQTYDDFVSPTSGAIRTIAWQGIYLPPTPMATSFYVSIIPDFGNGIPNLDFGVNNNSGRPTGLYFATFPVAQVDERPDTVGLCLTPRDNERCGFYDYSVTLTTPLIVNAGLRYWFFVQADVPFDSLVAWGWRRGTPDNQRAVSNLGFFAYDLAFSVR